MFWQYFRLLRVLCLLALPGLALAQTQYPDTRKGDAVDTCFGTQVADPYRWLEDADSEETNAWIRAQNALSSAYLARIPERAAIRERVARLWNFEKYSVPYKLGKYYFYSHNTGLQNQPVLFVTEDRKAQGRVLIDPNTLSADGTVALIGDHDDRVVPAHSYKFTAAMQAAQAGPAPILARIGTDTGHGAGKPTAKVIEERADILAFPVKSLGMKIREDRMR